MSDVSARLPAGVLVIHKYHGEGRIIALDAPFYVVRFKDQTVRVPFEYQEMHLAKGSDPQLEQLKFAISEVLNDFGAVQPEDELAKRWSGGELVLVPGNKETQEKRIPLDAFFKKVIGVREKLRVLEQKLNNHPKLSSEDKVELQGYVTRCYGSLTTFNVLFSDRGEPFKGSGE